MNIKYIEYIILLIMSKDTTGTVAPVPSPAVLDTMTKIIMGQTEMTQEEVISALEQTNYDLKRVIREYMGGGRSRVEETSTLSSMSTNQLRFSEIRSFMDKSDESYLRKKEMVRIYNEVNERKKAAAAAAAAAAAGAAAGAEGAAGAAESKL
jgi:hypothetical protein